MIYVMYCYLKLMPPDSDARHKRIKLVFVDKLLLPKWCRRQNLDGQLPLADIVKNASSYGSLWFSVFKKCLKSLNCSTIPKLLNKMGKNPTFYVLTSLLPQYFLSFLKFPPVPCIPNKRSHYGKLTGGTFESRRNSKWKS